MTRVANFSPGPATLPLDVLEQAQAELLDFQGRGVSVMEISHRSALFIEIAQQAEQDVRDLLAIPDHYHVLFLHGGGRSQFSMIPLNLLPEGQSADYLQTGLWSQLAIAEAQRYGNINIAADATDLNFLSIPDEKEWDCDPAAAYCYYTTNETVGGLQFPAVPHVPENVPLVADMSSDIFSGPMDIERFGLIFATAQKNIGPSGITLVIVRDDMLGHARSSTPTMFNYAVHAASHSMYNTPPTFSWYLAGLVFQWLKRQGGLPAMQQRNAAKAKQLYACIDASDFYLNRIDTRYRSQMNVVFNLADESLNALFLSKAEEAGLFGLKGHSRVGGMRASIYNAVTETQVAQLVTFMQHFEKERA